MLPNIMFERLLAFFEKGPASAPEPSGASTLQRAAAVLLAIAARLDGHAAPDERESIVRLLRVRLGVEDAGAVPLPLVVGGLARVLRWVGAVGVAFAGN